MPEIRYSKDHEYIRVENGTGTIGITSHAQEKLGDVTYVETPQIGKIVQQSEQVGVVESVKAASDIYAPVKGTVVEANKALEADPGLINREPYGQGWIFVLKIENPDDLKNLKDAAGYKKHIG